MWTAGLGPAVFVQLFVDQLICFVTVTECSVTVGLLAGAVKGKINRNTM